ncbi:hypothetical protein [Hyphomonas sp.]|jgi:hypothetical protein|uniref:hypothetical protein n=1 Tax=Hyphomonas sp. TaxID=87 RepID=UPI000C968F52|nr:hypothetical protein [Hyphomonas sp.]MAL44516.1 hypothetical protein [Hyphomonas sp.]|tara:strand:+ start:137 stop:349 length:213 start_codon:yes stop_codon:yes gene_type:complete
MLNVNVSDLFFNFEHENYDKVIKDTINPTQDEIYLALKRDASFFLDCFGDFNINFGYTVDDLCKDFLSRL